MKNNYGGIIWTNHALSRMRERGIKQGDAWTAFRKPDNSKYSKKKGAWIYSKTLGNKKIEVLASKDRDKKWVIVSAWSKTRTGESNHLSKKRNNNVFKLIKKIFR